VKKFAQEIYVLLFPNRDRAKFVKSCNFEFMHRIKKIIFNFANSEG